MPEAVTPPNPADSNDKQRTAPDPTLLTIDALRREIAMLESLMSAMIKALEALTDERFHRVDSAMAHYEDLRREQKVDTKEAVDAALEAQKEATTKMERSISEQLAALRTNFETSIRGVQSTISDLKDRLTAMESLKQGQIEQKDESRQISAGVVAAIGVGLALLLTVLAVVSFLAGNA